MMTAVKPWLCVKHRRCLLIQLSVCLVAASLIGFGLIGVPTVQEYRDTRHFVSTICTVERSVLDNSSSVSCRHTESRHRGGMDHNSSFPCLTVRVGYEPRGGSPGEDAVTEAVLYMTYYSYSKCPSNKACSLYVCSSDRQHNVDHVLKFRDKYANTGQHFTCFYKPGQRDVVLLKVTTLAGLTHALLWPSLILLLGLAIGVCVVCRCQVKDKVKELHCRLRRPSGAQNTFTQIQFVRLNSAT
ncbi:hypothetical protein LSAT2_000296 [Lamellibrachia satsuma]|nr:hypothetical protein LSAT2_000296 [Lamellibrachia satsuma]